MTIISLHVIRCSAVDAADAGQLALSACPWPQHSAAVISFIEAYDKRTEQLNLMAEA